MKRIVLYFPWIFAAAAVILQGCRCDKTGGEAAPEVHTVIYMIGDGMGVAQISAMMLDGQYSFVNLERATSVGFVKTFSANDHVTDSAAGGTALATGNKTNNGMVGMTPDSVACLSIMDFAAGRGWSTGLVVTSYITDATPAAFYAHVPDRKMLDSIAVQFAGSGVDVAIGGGLNYFSAECRNDKRDVLGELAEAGYAVTTDFDRVAEVTQGKLTALLADTFMAYSQDGREDYLPVATAKALEILENNSGCRGIFLMVEGSLIDYAAHDNNAERVISEVRDFDRAVGVAFDYADMNPGTLVVVTADHETGGLTMPSSKSVNPVGRRGVSHAFSSGDHTATMVPLFAYGTGAEAFSGIMDNTGVASLIRSIITPAEGGAAR